MPKLLIITDSLGLPRNQSCTVLFSEIWPNLIKTELSLGPSECYIISIGGATIAELINQVENVFGTFIPDIIILQSGIVDASPRALSKLELGILNSNFIFKKVSKLLLPKLVKKLRKYRKLTYTSIRKYEDEVLGLKEKFKKSSFIVIPIVHGNLDRYEKIVPGISGNISKFNNVLLDVFDSSVLTIPTGLMDSGICDDLHHLNKEGHYLIANEIVHKIQLIIRTKIDC